jgi:hypothetical protein
MDAHQDHDGSPRANSGHGRPDGLDADPPGRPCFGLQRLFGLMRQFESAKQHRPRRLLT